MEKIFDRCGITLYRGDCMDYLQAAPDRAFSLAIVDPPYGDGNGTNFAGRFGQRFEKSKHAINGQRNTRFNRRERAYFANAKVLPYAKKKTEIGWDTAPPPEYFAELFRVSERQIVWGGNYFGLPPARGFAVWDKLVPDAVSFASAEYAWLSWPVNARIFRGAPVQYHNSHGEKCRRFHPPQKPEALYRWLLRLWGRAGDVVLDTHAGSCSSQVACYQMGFPATGIELDPEYCAKAVERLEVEMAQPRLIDLSERREINGELSF